MRILPNLTAAAATLNGYRFEGKPALCDSFEQWQPPRVMVSNSMLQAYSEMRGNNDKRNFQFGPLHESLFRAERGNPGEDQLELPALNSRDP